jgi:hypothetical protein
LATPKQGFCKPRVCEAVIAGRSNDLIGKDQRLVDMLDGIDLVADAILASASSP